MRSPSVSTRAMPRSRSTSSWSKAGRIGARDQEPEGKLPLERHGDRLRSCRAPAARSSSRPSAAAISGSTAASCGRSRPRRSALPADERGASASKTSAPRSTARGSPALAGEGGDEGQELAELPRRPVVGRPPALSALIGHSRKCKRDSRPRPGDRDRTAEKQRAQGTTSGPAAGTGGAGFAPASCLPHWRAFKHVRILAACAQGKSGSNARTGRRGRLLQRRARPEDRAGAARAARRARSRARAAS